MPITLPCTAPLATAALLLAAGWPLLANGQASQVSANGQASQVSANGQAAQASANGQAAPAPAEPVILPPVERRPVRVPTLPSRDIVAGLFAGTYGTQNFGSSAVAGLRLGYHITEHVFVESALAQTKVSDENYRQVLPGGVFADRKETLSYINLSAGYNLLPGEVFIGTGRAKVSALYLLGGIGSTRFHQQRKQTLHFGMGMRVFLGERVALQVDMRDHVFSLDLLGKRQSTQNLEWTGGLTLFF